MMNQRTRHFVNLALMLGYEDLKQTYRRSALGPFWITIGMTVQIVVIGLVFGLIFKSQDENYGVFVSIGLIFWAFINASINEGSQALINSAEMIRQLKLPMWTYFLRSLYKNFLIFLHNIIILPIAYLFSGEIISSNALLVIPGFILLILNLYWIMSLAAIFSTRYRDVPPIINSLLVMFFYLTPIMWFPELLDNSALAHNLLGLNPLYHLIQLVRLPLLGSSPTIENWLIPISLVIVGNFFSIAILRKFKSKIPMWV